MSDENVMMGQAALRTKELKARLMESIKGFPDDVVVLNFCFDVVTNNMQIVGPRIPDDVAAHVRDLVHKVIEQWYENNLKMSRQ